MTMQADCHKNRTAEEDLRELIVLMKQCDVLGEVPQSTIPKFAGRLEMILESLKKRSNGTPCPRCPGTVEVDDGDASVGVTQSLFCKGCKHRWADIYDRFQLNGDAYARLLLLIGDVSHRQRVPTQREVEDTINGRT